MKKTITFAMLHFTVAFTVAYLFTGSLLIGGAMALVDGGCAIGMPGFGVGICIGGIYNAPSVRIMQPVPLSKLWLRWLA